MMLKSTRFLFWAECWIWLPRMLPRLFNTLLGIISLGRLTYDSREKWLWNPETQQEEKLKPITYFEVICDGYFSWWMYSCGQFMDELLGIVSAVLGIISLGYVDRIWHVNWFWNLEQRRQEARRVNARNQKN